MELLYENKNYGKERKENMSQRKLMGVTVLKKERKKENELRKRIKY